MHLELCPVDCCVETEIKCPGAEDQYGEQLTADFCIPKYNDHMMFLNPNQRCLNSCPIDCGERKKCFGGMDDQGCPRPKKCCEDVKK